MMTKVSPNLSELQRRKTLRAIFLILFIDLMGFSIIFPLFPAMLAYYLQREGHSGFLGDFLRMIQGFQSAASGGVEVSQNVPLVLFGGILGSLYSLLQFVFAPIWGTLSDRWGRKPILLISLAGIALSYVVWFFAHSFLLLVLSRIISGMMGGNISTATAVVSDVTDSKKRSSGMAMIGIAFGLGFILGPAIGGIFWYITQRYFQEFFASWHLNPFALIAAFAFLLSLINFIYVLFTFTETLPRGANRTSGYRILNPLAVLSTRKFPGAWSTILTYFLFLTIFSGMEFSLTFLAAERLAFQPHDNSLMFVFVGVVLALVQGGYVRRKVHHVGERKMSWMGISLVIPGLVFIGLSHHVWQLYTGLFFLAVGAAMVTPSLTSLVSLYTPWTDQGRVLGIFRSMGALARAVGPLIACILYWRFSATSAYLFSAGFLLLPALMSKRLPAVVPQPES